MFMVNYLVWVTDWLRVRQKGRETGRYQDEITDLMTDRKIHKENVHCEVIQSQIFSLSNKLNDIESQIQRETGRYKDEVDFTQSF